jgi:hypothetical protein
MLNIASKVEVCGVVTEHPMPWTVGFSPRATQGP